MKEKKIFYYIVIGILAVIIGALLYNIIIAKNSKIEHPVATVEIKDYGTITMELYPEYAPQSVANFIALAENGYYNGTKIHRVVKDFMIQGGDKNGDGSGGVTKGDLLGQDTENAEESYSIKGEFKKNGVTNPLSFEEGTVAMARADYTQQSATLDEESYNSAGSQFFIMTKANAGLNGDYAAFGKVTDGLNIVHDIENVEVEVANPDSEAQASTEVSKPVTDVIIESVKVDTKGVKYDKPEMLEPFNYTAWLYSQYGIDPSTMAQSN